MTRIALAIHSPFAFAGYEGESEIHRGGQGVVYQCIHRATRRKAAIKVLRNGAQADPRERARFEREAQVLGALHHPHIVTIHDSGEVAGHVYIVMDFIDGRPLDEYMRANPHGVRDALRLFTKVCEAVNAAHLCGVIHRDLKPSNIRVDTSGDPHVLDFGLAKITNTTGSKDDQPVPEITLTGQFVGTPAWASPEQAHGDSESVDVRSDVYALGLLLFQMLTGQLPYSVKGDPRTVLDTILNTQPVKPSAIRSEIDDEVETIVLKCLCKEPDRRYQSAGELVRDIEHHLRGEAIEAKRDSSWYVIRKTLRKHRLLVIGTVSTIIALVGGILGTSYGMVQADRARQMAAEEAQAATTLNRLLRDILLSPSAAGRGHNARMTSVLDHAAQTNEANLPDQPLRRADLHVVLAETFQLLALFDSAGRHARAALDLRRQLLGTAAPETLAATTLLGEILTESNKFDEAERVLEEALPRARQTLTLDRPELPKLLEAIGQLRSRLGKDVSGALIREALDIRRIHQAADVDGLAESTGLLGEQRRGHDDQEACALLNEALTLTEQQFGPDSAQAATILANLAVVRHFGLNQHEEAVVLYTRASELLRRHFGDDHPYLASMQSSLGLLHHANKRYDEAEACYQEALLVHRQFYGDHDETRTTLTNLSMLAKDRGDTPSAIAYAREAAEMASRIFRPSDPKGDASWVHFGALADSLGQHEASQEAWSRLLAIRELRYPDGSVETADVHFLLARALYRLDRPLEAVPHGQMALELRQRLLNEGDGAIVMAEQLLTNILTKRDASKGIKTPYSNH